MTDTWGWIAIVAVPVAFWVLIVALAVVVFGRDEVTERFEGVELEEAVIEPTREAAPASGGLGWGPPVPSHH